MTYKAKIAVSHPGRIGDALYALPTARFIYESTGQKVDFYTSEYCRPMKNLMEYQECINEFIIPSDYVIERHDCGIQPWLMPIPDRYAQVFQLGFRGVPDEELHTYIAKTAGIYAPLDIYYDFEDLGRPINKPYVCIAPRGNTSYTHLLNQLVDALLERDIYAAITGGPNENALAWKDNIVDFTGCDLLDTLSILHHSQGFVGLMSSQLVLANGFNIPKIGLNGLLSDMRHAIKSPTNYYPEDPYNPSLETIVNLLDKT